MMYDDTLLFCSLINYEIYIVKDTYCNLRIIQGYLRKLLEVGLIATREREPIAVPYFLNSALIVLILRWAISSIRTNPSIKDSGSESE